MYSPTDHPAATMASPTARLLRVVASPMAAVAIAPTPSDATTAGEVPKYAPPAAPVAKAATAPNRTTTMTGATAHMRWGFPITRGLSQSGANRAQVSSQRMVPIKASRSKSGCGQPGRAAPPALDEGRDGQRDQQDQARHDAQDRELCEEHVWVFLEDRLGGIEEPVLNHRHQLAGMAEDRDGLEEQHQACDHPQRAGRGGADETPKRPAADGQDRQIDQMEGSVAPQILVRDDESGQQRGNQDHKRQEQ